MRFGRIRQRALLQQHTLDFLVILGVHALHYA